MHETEHKAGRHGGVMELAKAILKPPKRFQETFPTLRPTEAARKKFRRVTQLLRLDAQSMATLQIEARKATALPPNPPAQAIQLFARELVGSPVAEHPD